MPFYIDLPAVLLGLNIIDNTDSAKFTFESTNGEIIDINIKAVSRDIVFDERLGKGKEGEYDEDIPSFIPDKIIESTINDYK